MEEAQSTTTNQSVTTESKKGLTGQQCMDIIRKLAKSQGFYTRLYTRLHDLAQDEPGKFDVIMQDFEKQEFSDPADLVLYLED